MSGFLRNAMIGSASLQLMLFACFTMFIASCGMRVGNRLHEHKTSQALGQHGSHVVYVIGDTHGDRDFMEVALLATGKFRGGTIYNQPIDWNPQTAMAEGEYRIFILGDIVDRGVHDLHMLLTIKRLASHQSYGHHLVFLLGNHEAMALQGNLKYASAQKYAGSHRNGTWTADRRIRGLVGRADYIEEVELVDWLLNQKVIDRYAGVLLCHGGLSTYTLNKYMEEYGEECHADTCDALEGMNAEARAYFRSAVSKFRKLQAVSQNRDVVPDVLQSGNSGRTHYAGVLWYRGYSRIQPNWGYSVDQWVANKIGLSGAGMGNVVAAAKLPGSIEGAGRRQTLNRQAEVMDALDAGAMVVAHTTHDFIVRFGDDAPVFLVDTHRNSKDADEIDAPGPSPGESIGKQRPQALKLETDDEGNLVRAESCIISSDRVRHKASIVCNANWIAQGHEIA